LAGQNPQFRRGHSLLSQLLIAGEFPLALVFPYDIDQAKKRGAPVEWVTTIDPVVTSPSQISISAKAAHPNGARLLVNFLLSIDGQQLLRERERIPSRTDLPAADPGAAPNLRLHFVSPKLAREFGRHEKEFEELFLKKR